MTQILKIIVACMIASAATAHASGPALEDPLPKEWRPDLNLVEENINDFFKDGGQQGFNLRTARVFEIRDAQLAIVYLQLYAVLPHKTRHSLKAEQAKWLKCRDDEVDKVAPKGEMRGSSAPMEENTRAIEITEERISELKRRFDKLR